jgi:thiosulfate sulfurtransferase
MAETIRESDRPGRGLKWMVALLVLLGAVAPPTLYWIVCGRIATVTPTKAKALLREEGGAAILVDVRPAETFAAGHIDGAVNWPLQKIMAAAGPADLPDSLRDKTLLLVCDVGMASRLAAWHLARVGVERAFNVRGGIQEWIRDFAEEFEQTPVTPAEVRERLTTPVPPQGQRFDRWQAASAPSGEFPFRASPMYEQAVAVLAFFFFKPIYTLLSLAVIVALWKSREADLVALRWGMIWFFLGENCCAVNYFVFKETSYLFEYLHSLGMALCFGFVAYAVLEGFDRRILALSDPQRRCAAVGLCAGCGRSSGGTCGLKQAFYWIIPALAVVALMLPTADWRDNSYNTWVFGHLYNYGHLRVYQQFENWYCAAAAIVMFSASLVMLASARDNVLTPAKVFFAAGVGPLGFGLLRMVLGAAYDQNRVWYLFWEETTELLFIAGVCFVLWTFRQGLLGSLRPPPVSGRTSI